MSTRRFDWELARAQLAASQAALEAGEMSDERRDAIFAQRAEALAPPPGTEAPADAIDVLIFGLGAERYAFSCEQVREVRVLANLTRVPAAPPFVAGLVNVRGRILTVLDLRALFGVPGDRESAAATLLLASPHGDVGVLTTDLPTIGQLRAGELGPLPSWAPVGLDAANVRGVSSDFVVLLDAERLLADDRIVLQDE